VDATSLTLRSLLQPWLTFLWLVKIPLAHAHPHPHPRVNDPSLSSPQCNQVNRAGTEAAKVDWNRNRGSCEQPWCTAARGLVGDAKFLAIVQPVDVRLRAGRGTSRAAGKRDGHGDVLVQREDGAPSRLHLRFIVVPIVRPRPWTAPQDRVRLRPGARHSSSSLHPCHRLPEFEPLLFFHSQ
jgi:hypothetical protein